MAGGLVEWHYVHPLTKSAGRSFLNKFVVALLCMCIPMCGYSILGEQRPPLGEVEAALGE